MDMSLPKFSSPEDLQSKISEYLEHCAKKEMIPTKGNLALFLDTTRETLSVYEEKEDYSDTIKRVYQVIEDAWVQRLKGQSVAGVIFYLKNAYSKEWRDKQETEVTGSITHQITGMKITLDGTGIQNKEPETA